MLCYATLWYAILCHIMLWYDITLCISAVCGLLSAQGQTMRLRGTNQLMFEQRVLANKTASPGDCIEAATSRGGSVFQCFAAYKYLAREPRWFDIKSLHIGYQCPLTGYHMVGNALLKPSPAVCLSLCVCLSVCLSVCQSVCLSVCLSAFFCIRCSAAITFLSSFFVAMTAVDWHI